jgi:peptidoglycan/xylan/chitin deacetylase (PgdA/CDA1 family)
MMTGAEHAESSTADDPAAGADAWLSESDAAGLLGMSLSFVHRQVASGALKVQERDKVCLISRGDLDDYIEASRIQPRSSRLRPPPGPPRVASDRSPRRYVPSWGRRRERPVVISSAGLMAGLIAGLVIVGLVGLLAAQMLSSRPQVRVDGRAAALPSSGTVGGVLRAAHVRLPGGRLYSLVSRRVLETDDRAVPPVLLVNGRPASLGARVRPGDRIAVLPGSATEAAALKDETTAALLTGAPAPGPTSQTIQHEGLPDVERFLWHPGSQGAQRVVTGAVSGEVLSRALVPPSPAVAETGKVVALTFDDGPDPLWTPQVLSILHDEGISATFCLIARQVPGNAEVVRHEVADGDTVCDHTVDHDVHLDRAPRGHVADQIDRGADIIASVAGVQPSFYRPPGGTLSPTVIDVAHARGLRVLYWSVDPSDYLRPLPGVILQRVLAGVRPGAIILLHDGGGDRSHTVAVLRPLIDSLKAQGYGFTTLAGESSATAP